MKYKHEDGVIFHRYVCCTVIIAENDKYLHLRRIYSHWQLDNLSVTQ